MVARKRWSQSQLTLLGHAPILKVNRPGAHHLPNRLKGVGTQSEPAIFPGYVLHAREGLPEEAGAEFGESGRVSGGKRPQMAAPRQRKTGMPCPPVGEPLGHEGRGV